MIDFFFFDDFWSFLGGEEKGEKQERKETFYAERLCETKRVIAVVAALIQTSAKERGLVFVFPR